MIPDKLTALLEDEAAVSPVIGVILMVAITVILAAVIGTFVLGLGGQASQSAPQASFTIQDAGDSVDSLNSIESGSFDPDNDYTDLITIRHGGSDTLQADETEIRLTNGSDTITIFDGTQTNDDIITPSGFGDDDDVLRYQGPEFTDGEFSTAETVTISVALVDLADDETDPGLFDASGQYTVTIIDSPSGQIIVDRDVNVD